MVKPVRPPKGPPAPTPAPKDQMWKALANLFNELADAVGNIRDALIEQWEDEKKEADRQAEKRERRYS